MLSFKNRTAVLIVCGVLIALPGCVTTNQSPVNDVPIAIEKRGFYESARAYARYGDGTLYVYGNVRLAHNVSLPWNFYAQVRILDANGQTIAEIPAILDRGERHYRGDPLLDASIDAETKIPFAQVKRIEIVFDKIE